MSRSSRKAKIKEPQEITIEIDTPEEKSREIRVESSGVRQPGVQQPGVQQPGVQQPGVQQPGAQQSFSNIGSKIVKSKDVIDTSIPLFTTQKKRVLDFAIQNKIPSKFIFPIYDNQRIHTRSEISNDLETIEDYIKRESKKLDVSQLVENIKENDPRIKSEEVLFYISNFVNGEDFFESASRINPAYEDPETFMNDKYNWEREEFLRLLERDIQDIQQLEIYFENIQSIDPVQTSDMTIEKMTLDFDVIVKDETDTLINSAPDLFANIKTSYDVPFVKYNDRYFSKFKVFSGDTFESRPPFKLFQHHFTKFEEKNMIYMILLVDPGTNMAEYTKKSYISVSLNLSKNVLSFKYFVLTNRPENEIIQSILNVIPNIKLINRQEKNYGANFNIYNTFIRDDSFLDILISEPFIAVNSPKIFSAVLFADESEKPISEKKKLKVYYDTNIGFEADTALEEGRNEELSKLAALGFYMTQYKSGVNDSGVSKGRYTITEFTEEDEKIIGTKDTVVKSLFLPTNTPYIVVSVSKAVNRFVLFQFMNVFARLLTIYNQVRDVYEDEYNDLIPELKDPKIQEQELTLILKPAKTIGKEKRGKINLRTIAPEIFTDSYSRECQYKNQPIIITETEIDSWKNRKIIKGSKTIERPVKQLGDYNFVCPTDVFPYVEFKRNLDEDRTFDQYPCCYKNAQGGVRQRERGTSQRSNVPIKTNKIMGEGGIANLPTSIEEMLQGAFAKPLTFYRTGSLISPSSFLACIALALEDPIYLNLKTVEEKENYIQKLRLQIAEKENFLTTSSELFDVAEKDRVENFKRVDEFLDPAIYYRVIEELFKVNIFVFSGTLHKANVETVYTLEISRFSSIPMHSFKSDVPTILIYKHWGAETDHLEYPQCELIIAYTGEDTKKIEEGSTASLFSDDLAKYLLKGYFISAGVYGRLYIPEKNIFENYSSGFIYQLLTSDFLNSFLNKSSQVSATGQIIDEKGKLCGLQIKTPYGAMTIGVPALPPQNLPLQTKIETPKLSDVFKVFTGEPTGYSYDGDTIISVWFRLLDLEFGIQVPVNPENKEQIRKEYRKLLPNVPENRFYLENNKLSEIQRLLKLKKDVNTIVQLVRWIYLIAIDGEGFSQPQKIEAAKVFLDNMLTEIPRKEPDSALVYDFSKLPRKLPQDRSSIEVILQEIQKTAPTFTDGEKILISGRIFYSRIRESLEHYVRLNLPITIPNYLDGYYESVYDYPKSPKTLIFLSGVDFRRWLEQAVEDPTSTYPVLYSLRGKLSELKHPYLYSVEAEQPSTSNPFGQSFLFLIQNAPFVHSKASALENCIRWRDVHVNHPKISDVLLSKFRNYKVFTISQSESFEVIEDMSDEEDLENTIFILQYPGTDKYASVLPI
jgi:hypothetical protein